MDCLFVSVFVCLVACLFVCLFVLLFVCLGCVFVCLFVCLFVWLFVWRAPGTLHSPSQRYFIILDTERCPQSGDHSLRSRTERERAPTTNLCGNAWGHAPRVHTQPHKALTLRGVTNLIKQRAHEELGTLRHKSISNFWVPNHVPKAVTIVCALGRRVSARRRLTSAWQFVGPRDKNSHSAAQGRDALRRDRSNKAARA